ncbi:MAG TPA: hypothetical protein VJJ72_00725 [Candidatus Paceibacterota bacterium]
MKTETPSNQEKSPQQEILEGLELSLLGIGRAIEELNQAEMNLSSMSSEAQLSLKAVYLRQRRMLEQERGNLKMEIARARRMK